MPAQPKSDDVITIVIGVLVIAVGLYIAFNVVNYLADNIRTILIFAAIGLMASIVAFYFSSRKAS